MAPFGMGSDSPLRPEQEYAAALANALRCFKMSQVHLEKLSGVTAKTLRAHLTGEVIPQEEKMKDILEALTKEHHERERRAAAAGAKLRSCGDTLMALERAIEAVGNDRPPSRPAPELPELREVRGGTPIPPRSRSSSIPGARSELFTFGHIQHPRLVTAALVIVGVLILATVATGNKATLAASDFRSRAAGSSPLTLAAWAADGGASESVEGQEFVLRTASRTSTMAPEAAADLDARLARTDTVVAVDARVVGNPTEVFASINCRFSGPGEGYGFSIIPATGEFALAVYGGQGKQPINLAPRQMHGSIRRGNNPNRLELSCVGSTITGRVNGEEVAKVEDRTYPAGGVWIGVGAYSSRNPTGEVHFGHLVVKDCAWWARPASEAGYLMTGAVGWFSPDVALETEVGLPRC
jgi:hypothetical protein